jgi:hypothetical protein
VHWLDLYWLLMPALHPQSTAPSWMDLAAFLGLGGVGVAFGVWALRGRYAVPIGDPFLAESLRYSK